MCSESKLYRGMPRESVFEEIHTTTHEINPHDLHNSTDEDFSIILFAIIIFIYFLISLSIFSYLESFPIDSICSIYKVDG